MPTIAIVDGVALIIYSNDHLPPHIHAQIAEYECKILIASGEVIQGEIPPAKLRKVQSWLKEHFDDVSFAWEEVYSGRGFKGRIK